MTDIERDEMKALPEKYRPLNAWQYFGYGLLFSLPLIGFILAIVFSFSDENINRRSFARSYFCGLLVAAIVVAVLTVLSVTGVIALASLGSIL